MEENLPNEISACRKSQVFQNKSKKPSCNSWEALAGILKFVILLSVPLVTAAMFFDPLKHKVSCLLYQNITI